MKRLAALALAATLPALAAEVRVITPTSHSLFPAGAGAGSGSGAGAADASALKPPARALPSPILVERRADIGADGSLLLSCAGQDQRDFRRLPAATGAAR